MPAEAGPVPGVVQGKHPGGSDLEENHHWIPVLRLREDKLGKDDTPLSWSRQSLLKQRGSPLFGKEGLGEIFGGCAPQQKPEKESREQGQGGAKTKGRL